MSDKPKRTAQCYDPLCEIHNPAALAEITKNKPTGEWTKEGKFGINVGHKKCPQCYDTGSRDLLFDAHNAALSAERESSAHETVCKLRNQLATEQELTKEARLQRDWLIKECKRIGVTVNVLIGAPTTEAYQLVNKQLAAEQRKYSQITHKWELCVTEIQQLSSQVQTLVDALKEIRGLVTLRRIHQIVDAALAKVKEGE